MSARTWLGSFAVLAAGAAWAAPQSPAYVGPSEAPREELGLQQLVADLEGSDRGDRILAARDLRREARRALKLSNRRLGDELLIVGAQVELQDFDRLVAPACTELLEVGSGSLTRCCADILGLLETQAALPALRRAQSTSHGWTARRLARSVRRIEEAQEP